MSTAEQRRKLLKLGLRWTVFTLAVAAIGYMVYQSREQLLAESFSLNQVNWRFWLLAIVSYLSAMLLANLFWYRVLIALGQRPKISDCLAAFFTSQLGKYIPGKAMVVVIRTDLVRGPQVNARIAAASVFVETLTWIFIGSAIASLLLILRFRDQSVLQWTAGVLTVAAGVLTWPAIFQKLAGRLTALGQRDQEPLKSLGLSTMAFGWVVMSLGWCLNGLSLWLVIKGLPETTITGNDYPLTLACVSLATVAGFVTLLPGGVGVRELVMIPLLSPTIGAANAIIAAVVIRLVWLTSELLAAGIIYLVRLVTSRMEETSSS